MVLVVGKTEIVSKLSIRDLASNQIFYRRSSLREFHNDLNALTESESKLEQDETKKRIAWCEATALCKVIDFICEEDREKPGSTFSVKSLEEQYMSLLCDQDTKYTSHVTRFADELVENINGLNKDTTHKKIIIYLQQDVSKMMYNSCDSWWW